MLKINIMRRVSSCMLPVPTVYGTISNTVQVFGLFPPLSGNV